MGQKLGGARGRGGAPLIQIGRGMGAPAPVVADGGGFGRLDSSRGQGRLRLWSAAHGKPREEWRRWGWLREARERRSSVGGFLDREGWIPRWETEEVVGWRRRDWTGGSLEK